MTWDTLEALLAALDPPVLPDREQPAQTLQHLEGRADEDPADRALAACIRAVADCVDASADRGTTTGGVRRERLLRWDSWTRTWIGLDLETGGEAVLRELLPGGDRPVRRRALHREARVLEPLVPGLRHGGTTEAWLAAPLPGTPLPSDPSPDPVAVARMLGTTLAGLRAYEQAGLWPVLVAEQLRWTDAGAVVVPVEAAAPRDAGPRLTELALQLTPDDAPDAPIFEVLSALVHAPPLTLGGAVDAVERSMATDLAARRHTLFLRRRQTAHLDRIARLLELVQRLGAALPPPEGRGAIGVDLEGRTLAVERRKAGIWWGPPGEMAPVWTRTEGFLAPDARRLLRIRAQAAPAPHLQTEVDGTAEATDAIGRWIAAGLKARTVRLLLDKELSRTADP